MLNSNTYKAFFLFLFIYFAYQVPGLHNAPLLETTEGRYAEIAREMLVSGDYIEPRLNGIKHFHKPPLAYWMMALGMKIFGVNGFGARIFGVVASIFSIIILYLTSEIFFKKEESLLITIICSSTILFTGAPKVVSTDAYLILFTFLSLLFLYRQIFVKKCITNTLLYAFFMGLGFITKGPVIFLFTLLPYFICKIFSNTHRKVFSLKEILGGVTLFLLISLPWYLIVIIKNPLLLDYFINTQTIDRISTNRFHRNQPVYFFLAIFAVTFFPYTFYFIKGLFNFKKLDIKIQILYLYIIIPLIFFSFSKSKLLSYIIPFYGIASIVTFDIIKNFKSRRFEKLSSYILIFIHILLIIYLIFGYTPLLSETNVKVLILLWLTFIIAFFMFNIKIKQKNFIILSASSLFFIILMIYLLLPSIGPESKGYKKLTENINVVDPDKNIDIMVYKAFIPSISFYRNKISIFALGKKRETQFEYDRNYKQFYIDKKNEVSEVFNKRGEMFVVTKPKYKYELEKNYNLSCGAIYKQRKYSAYLCKEQKGSS